MCADFTAITLDINVGSTASPAYQSLGGANTEVRFSDLGTGQLSIGSAAWAAMIRPGATQVVPYMYAFTADATGHGVYGGGAGANPATFSNTNRLMARWAWDAVGTFASAPIFTAYDTTAHNSPAARGGGGILAGHVTDTGATARSYLKANLYGQVSSVAVPAAPPGAAPTVTDGTTGSVSPTAGANWLAAYQGLMADLDFVTFVNTPAPTAANTQHVMLALFTGPNQTPGVWTPQISLRYTWT